MVVFKFLVSCSDFLWMGKGVMDEGKVEPVSCKDYQHLFVPCMGYQDQTDFVQEGLRILEQA